MPQAYRNRNALAVNEIIWGIKVLLVLTSHYVKKQTNIHILFVISSSLELTEQHITWQIISQYKYKDRYFDRTRTIKAAINQAIMEY